MNKNLLLFAIALMVTGLQVTAWILGKDGTVFALTTSAITGILGYLFAKATVKKE